MNEKMIKIGSIKEHDFYIVKISEKEYKFFLQYEKEYKEISMGKVRQLFNSREIVLLSEDIHKILEEILKKDENFNREKLGDISSFNLELQGAEQATFESKNTVKVETEKTEDKNRKNYLKIAYIFKRILQFLLVIWIVFLLVFGIVGPKNTPGIKELYIYLGIVEQKQSPEINEIPYIKVK